MIYLRLALLLALAVVSCHSNMQKDVDEAKMQEMYNCFFGILCKARKPREFRRVMLKAHPELIQKGFVWLKEISNIDASDTDEFWDNYPKYKCHLPEETKFSYFCEWMKRLGEYWAVVCAEQESEKCLKMAAAEGTRFWIRQICGQNFRNNEYNIVSGEYTANGICSAHGTEMGQRKMEEGKEAMQGGFKNMKGGNPMMG